MTSLLHLGEGLGAPHMNIDGYALFQEANSLQFYCSDIAPKREWCPCGSDLMTLMAVEQFAGVAARPRRRP